MEKLLIISFLVALISLTLFSYKKDIKNEGFLFSKKTNENTQEKEITLVSTGDIGLVRDINYKIVLSKNPNFPFLKIADYLKSADLTITNLEGPLINNCPIIREGFTFCGEDSNVSGLNFAGIDAANLANNHTTNYGLEGLGETVQVLRSNNIVPFGIGDEVSYITIKDKRIALVGFVELGNSWEGLNNATQENVSSLVSQAKENADVVIAAFHWGVEYTRKPTENQVMLAHLAIDSGADIVLGNHPHWIQTNEIYKDKKSYVLTETVNEKGILSQDLGNRYIIKLWQMDTKSR